MFSGTVRSNLDPFDEFGSDHDLWEALRECGLADQVCGHARLACHISKLVISGPDGSQLHLSSRSTRCPPM